MKTAWTVRCEGCKRQVGKTGRCPTCRPVTPEEVEAEKAAVRRQNGHETAAERKPWVKGPDPRPAPRPSAAEMKTIEHVLKMIGHLSPLGRAYVAASLEQAS